VAYAVIQTGGKQFRVSSGDIVEVPSLKAEVDSKVEFDVLLKSDGDTILTGSPVVEGAKVEATVLRHGRGAKVIVFKKKRRKHFKKKHGHRQNYTAVRIDAI
jgi:large subunit ribosomal protein L21